MGSRGPGGISVALAPALLRRARRMGGLPVRAGGPVQAEPQRSPGRQPGCGVLLQGLGEADGVPPPRGPRGALPRGWATRGAGPGVLRPAAARGPPRLPPGGRLQRRPPPLRPLGVGPGLADGHLRGHVRGSLRLSAGREAEGVPPGPAPPPAALRLGHPAHDPGPAPAAVRGLHAHRRTPGDGRGPGPAGRQGGGQPGEGRARALPPAPGLHARPPHRPRVRRLGPGLRLRRDAAVPDRPTPNPASGGQGPARALRVPRNVPRALLWMPVPSGGFGFPHLYSRMRLRHV